MRFEAGIHPLPEPLTILGQHPGAFLETDPLGAITAVIDHVAGSLVGKQIHGDLMVNQVLQEVDDVAMVGDRQGAFFRPWPAGRR
jgi:hypothetical protein